MTPGLEPEAILAQARARGVDVVLTEAGGLELLSAGAPPPDIVTLIKAAKPEVIDRLRTEQRLIARWIDHRIVDWDQDFCFSCRRRVLAGQKWIDRVSVEGARARFHEACLPLWLAELEPKARQVLGLPLQTGKEIGHARE